MNVLALSAIIVSAGDCSAEPLPIPTRAEVIAFDLDAFARKEDNDCVPFSLKKGERCPETRRPVELKGKAVTELTRILRDRNSYDSSRAMKCHDPRHRVRFYYGTSALDVYDVCFACRNATVGGANPFVGCDPNGKSSMPDVMTFSDAALEQVRVILERAKVGLVPKPSVKD